jgi:uncharacterized protein (TIGR02270 family)
MSQIALDGTVAIHSQEAASLFETRRAQLGLAHVNLSDLQRLDDRLLAHFDGLAVAGEYAYAPRLLDAELENISRGAAFALAVWAIEGGRVDRLDRLWSLVSDAPVVAEGRHLQGVVRDLMRSTDGAKRAAGLAACAMHRADPGLETGPWLGDPVPGVRARALRSTGEIGLAGIAAPCVTSMADDDGDCRFWAAWSAVLLGNRGAARDALRRVGLGEDAPHRDRAFRLTLQALDTPLARAMLKGLASNPAQRRWLIQGSGIVGDTAYVPWLFDYMAAPETARLAGEAFTLITGADLDAFQIWRPQPEDFESGPSDEPGDENVEMDADEGLMWPDQHKVEKWWAANSHRFQEGQRYFMGKPVTWEHCIDVLKHGYQRQRILAAHYLCLLRPGTQLFNTSAPAWRQQRLLAQMK